MEDTRTLSEGNYLGLYERDGWEFADRPNATGVVGILPLTSNAEVVLVLSLIHISEPTRPY